MKAIKLFIPVVSVLMTIQTAFCDVPFSVNPSDFRNWCAITAIVHDLNDTNISGTGDALAAFVGDECRGVAKAVHPPVGTRFFLQVWSNDSNDPGETISFQFFDAASETIHLIQEAIPFAQGMAVGTMNSPHVFHLSDPRIPGCIDPKAHNFDPMAEVNDGSCFYAPELAYIDDQIIDEDSPLIYPLTATDGDNDLLTFTSQISNTSFSTKIDNQTLIVSPPKDFYGTVDLTVIVTDGQYSDTCDFKLIVQPVNDPPVISSIPDKNIYENSTSSAIYFNVVDIENDDYQVSVQSSNMGLVNDDGIMLTVDQWSWYVTLTPLPDKWGVSQITITVNDGHMAAHESFLLTVRPLTVQPTISEIPTVFIQENSVSEPIPFTVTDIVYSDENIHLTVTTTNPQLVPMENIQILKNFVGRYLIITPVIDQSGSATITLKASNPRYSVNSVFTVIVKSKNEIAIFKRFQKLDDQGNPLADNATSFTMVHDLITDLIWEIKPPDNSMQGNDRQFTWYNPDNATNGGFEGATTPAGDTLYYIDWLNRKFFGGQSNWRMPEIFELMSLIHVTKNSPHIASQFFPNAQSGCYWSATPHAQYAGDAWMVDFSDGTDDYVSKAHSCYIRSVRGKIDACLFKADRFVDNLDNTITDTCTGYMWAKNALPMDTYHATAEACQNLTLAGNADWRFPSRKEMRSLIRFDRYDPAIATNLFNQGSDWFWTKDQPPDKKNAWAIFFYYGASYIRNLNYEYYVRPVRAGPQESIQCFTVGMPLPGSQWIEDDLLNIQWQSCLSVDAVNIYLSRSGGDPDSFVKIADNYPNIGEFYWTVTCPQTKNAMLKIENAANPLVHDKQGLFQIIGQPLPGIDVFPKTISIPAKGGKAKISITNIGEGILEWQINIFNEWIAPQSSLSGVDNGWFEFRLAENPGDTRTACIVISASNADHSPQKVCLSQAGNEFIDLFKSVSAGDLTDTLESAWGCNWVDYNHDGWMDIFVINRHSNNSLYRNNKNRTFTRISDHILVNYSCDSTAATWGDYDNDNDVDVFIVHPQENNALYVNDGNGLFTLIHDDIVVTDAGISYGASWIDADNDGFLDLYVTNTGVASNALYINLGNGHFEKNSGARIIALHGKSLAWGDYRQNGYMDLIIPEQVALFLNTGQLAFYSMETSVLNLDSAQNSFESAVWADFDNDTYMDLYLTHQTQNNVLLHNDGQGGFQQLTNISPCTDGGQATNASWADFDRDGDLDLFVPRMDFHNLFYENNGNKQFTRISSGDVSTGNGQSSAVADYDNDGDMDILVVRSDDNHILLENQSADRHWIAIRCIGSDANRSAIGAQITVDALIYGRDIRQIRQISAQTGHSSMDSQIMLLGLGDQALIDQIMVNWPGGHVSRLQQVRSDQYITIIENESSPLKSLTASPLHQIVSALAASLSIKVIVENESMPLTWNAQTNDDWIAFNDIHTGTQTQDLNITISRNLGDQRAGYITILAENQGVSPITIEIIQKTNAPPQWHFPIQELYLLEDNNTAQVPFLIQDTDTEIADLVFTTGSENVNLFDKNSLSVNPHPITPNTMILLLTPVSNEYGESIVSLSVSDGINQLTDTIWVNVASINDVPMISGLKDKTIDEDMLVYQNFTVSDVEQDKISVQVQSLSPALFDDQAIWIHATGSTYRMEAKPIFNSYGTGQLQFTISDGYAAITRVVNISVRSVNDIPTISDIVDQELLETSIAIPFTIADAEFMASQLSVQAKTLAPELIPEDFMMLSGSNNLYTLTLDSPDNLFGIAPIELAVSDGFLTRTQQFNVFIRNAGNVPMIANVLDQQTTEDIPLYLTLTVGGVASESIVITGTSSNTALVNNSDIEILGIGQKRTLIIRPIHDAFGDSHIQLFVSDGTHTIVDDFIFYVLPVNDPPVISPIDDLWLREDTDSETVFFTTFDVDSNRLSVMAVSSDENIIPSSTMDLNSALGQWELSLKPVVNASGNCFISVQVSDGLTTTVESFNVEMRQMNDSPIIQPIPDQISDEDTAYTLFFSISDEETPLTKLYLSAKSSNLDLLTSENIVLDYHTMTLTPNHNAYGKTNITLSVDDGTGLPNAIQKDTFVFWVRSVNDLPEIHPIAPQTVSENKSITLLFTISDPETPATELITQASSDNQTLIPDKNLIIKGNGASRELQITPRAHYSGVTRIHVSVFDGTATISEAFTLTVNPYNYPPDFIIGMDLNIWEDALPQTLVKWATQISPGPLNENKQKLHFQIKDNTHPEYFTTPPVVTAQGDLHYTLAENAFGTAILTLILVDDGTENNESTPKRFQISISPVNDPPAFTKGQDIIIAEDHDNCQFDSWAKFISPGAENEANQELTFVLQTDAPDLFSRLPAVSDQGNLNFVPFPNANGIAHCQIFLKDNGEGQNSSPTENFIIQILPENDFPTMTQVDDQKIFEDQTLSIDLIIGDVDNSISALNLTVTASNPTLFPDDSFLITGSGNNRILQIMPSANQSGGSFIKMILSDGLADHVQSFSLTVLPVNDVPDISPIDHQYLQEDCPAVFIPLTVTDAESESAQISITAVANESDMFEWLDIQYISNMPFLHLKPSPNVTGTTTITIMAIDPEIPTDSGSLDITLTLSPVDDPPTIKVEPPFDMLEDSSAWFSVEINDVDTDLNTLFVNVQSSDPLVVPNDTNYLYIRGDKVIRNLYVKPYADANGAISLTITVSDNSNMSQQSINLNIEPENDAPIAKDFSLDIIEDQARIAYFKSIDVDADPLVYSIIAQGNLGNMTILSDNAFIYTPFHNQFGIDQVKYLVTDGKLNSNIGTIQVNIAAVNDTPLAKDLEFFVLEDRMMNGNLEGIDFDDDRLNYRIISSPQKGQISITDDRSGAFYYQPDMNACCQDTFTYKVYDGIIDSMTATVVMHITPVNDMPTVKPSALVVDEDTSGSNQVEGIDIDNDPLTYEIVSQQGMGSFVLMADGTYYYTPPADFNGTDIILFRGFDGQAFSNMERIDITVNPVNDAPVAYADQMTVNEDHVRQWRLYASDIDDDLLSFQIVDYPEAGSLTVLSSGWATYSPGNNYYGIDRFSFVANDGLALSEKAWITMTVLEINDKPVVKDQQCQGLEDGTLSGRLVGSDQENDSLTYAVTHLPQRGSLTYLENGEFTYYPESNYNGTDTFYFTASDGVSHSEPACLSLIILPVNDPPISQSKTYLLREDTLLEDFLIGQDIDQDTLSFQILVNGQMGTARITDRQNGAFTYTPDSNQHGIDTLTYRLSDGMVNAIPSQITLVIQSVNDAPVAISTQLRTLEDTSLKGQLSATDIDGDQLTYNVIESTQKGNFSIINVKTGEFMYFPDTNYSGSDRIKFQVTDAIGENSNYAWLDIEIQPVNDPPVAYRDTLIINEDQSVKSQLQGTDVDADPIWFVLENAPSNGTIKIINALSGTYVYTPFTDISGMDSFRFSVFDGIHYSEPASIDIEIVNINDPPVSQNAKVETMEDHSVSAILTATDPDNDVLTYKITRLPYKGQIDLSSDGTFTYTPNANENGTDTLTFIVNDGRKDALPSTVIITIYPINDPPFAKNMVVNCELNVPVTATFPIIDPDYQDGHDIQLVEWPENGTIQMINNGFQYIGFETGVDHFTYLASDGYLSSNVGQVVLLIGDIDLNPDIDRDGKIDLSDAVMGLHALVGMNSYDVNLRDIVFGMKFISGVVKQK
jgi:hypothetical protein